MYVCCLHVVITITSAAAAAAAAAFFLSSKFVMLAPHTFSPPPPNIFKAKGVSVYKSVAYFSSQEQALRVLASAAADEDAGGSSHKMMCDGSRDGKGPKVLAWQP